jgi:hypothetical protein
VHSVGKLRRTASSNRRCAGVEYIYEMGVTHLDLQLENLLLAGNCLLRISDFGNSECVRLAWEKAVHMVSGIRGSAPYMAPQEYPRSTPTRSLTVMQWMPGLAALCTWSWLQVVPSAVPQRKARMYPMHNILRTAVSRRDLAQSSRFPKVLQLVICDFILAVTYISSRYTVEIPYTAKCINSALSPRHRIKLMRKDNLLPPQ